MCIKLRPHSNVYQVKTICQNLDRHHSLISYGLSSLIILLFLSTSHEHFGMFKWNVSVTYMMCHIILQKWHISLINYLIYLPCLLLRFLSITLKPFWIFKWKLTVMWITPCWYTRLTALVYCSATFRDDLAFRGFLLFFGYACWST